MSTSYKATATQQKINCLVNYLPVNVTKVKKTTMLVTMSIRTSLTVKRENVKKQTPPLTVFTLNNVGPNIRSLKHFYLFNGMTSWMSDYNGG